MKIYRIFLKKTNEGVIDDLKLVKEGFNILAFVFQLGYLAYKGLWRQSFIIFAVFSFLGLISVSVLAIYIMMSIQICVCIYIGFEFSDWYSQKLTKSGYEFLGYSSGIDEKDAKLKFLDNINNNYTSEDKLEQKIF